MLPPVNPTGIPTGAEVQALADTEAGRELELGLPLPLTGVRLARCYLPWVNLAVTQVAPCGRTCPGDKGLTPSICHGLALLGRACMLGFHGSCAHSALTYSPPATHSSSTDVCLLSCGV